MIENDDNRVRLAASIRDAGLTQADAAELIGKHSGTPVALRTLQAWLAAPGHPSARPCPGWAVTILDAALAAGAIDGSDREI